MLEVYYLAPAEILNIISDAIKLYHKWIHAFYALVVSSYPAILSANYFTSLYDIIVFHKELYRQNNYLIGNYDNET